MELDENENYLSQVTIPTEPQTIEYVPNHPVRKGSIVDEETNKPAKAKVYIYDPHGVNKHLILSNPDLDDLDPDVVRQNASKLLEEEYKPKSWAIPKLNQIKKTSTLEEKSIVLQESLHIKDNIAFMDIQTPDNRKTTLEVSFFKGGIFKLSCLHPIRPSKFSFELIEKPANLTPYFIVDSFNKTEEGLEIKLAEAQLKVVFKFNPFSVVVLSTKPKAEEPLIEINTNNCLKFDRNVSADFKFHTSYLYGIPEHADHLLLENTKNYLPYRLYNNDLFGYPAFSKQALYGSIPIVTGRKLDSQTYISMFWQNTSESYIDFHKEEKTADVFWLSERGNFEVYLYANHSVKEHYEALVNITGKGAMPQYFSMGYHQCRYSYNDEQDLLQINEKFNEHEIPCDSVTLDIDHTNGFRYFTWDMEMFPDPVFMQDIIGKDGRKLITICDPHIKVSEDYHVYNGAVEKDLFVQSADKMPFVGVCFPGDCIWIDFINEEAREFWASQYSFENYKHSTPILFAWNDMNEPSVFESKDKSMPRENLHTVKSLAEPEKSFQIEHGEVHNIYGYCMQKGTYMGLLKRSKDQNIRPHVLSRAFFAGSQKWSTIWTGDTISTWEHLQITVPMMLSMALCGMSFIGGDVGGFLGNPEPELNVRWTQLGSYMPYFRGHCDKRYDRREPWTNTKEYYDIIKATIIEKYKFLSYWYTCFEDYCRTGMPVIRPIWFDPDAIIDSELMKEQEKFFVGESLLVVPIVQEGQMSIKGALKGLKGRWYDYYTKAETFPNDEVHTGLERIGVFVKGGHIIPQFEFKSNMKSSRYVKEGNIFLFVALDENETAKGTMYFDDGETFDFTRGKCTHKNFEFKQDTFTWEDTGSFGFTSNNKVGRIKLMGHKKKFNHAYLVMEGKPKQEIEIDNTTNFIRANFEAPACENWKVVFSLEVY